MMGKKSVHCALVIALQDKVQKYAIICFLADTMIAVGESFELRERI